MSVDGLVPRVMVDTFKYNVYLDTEKKLFEENLCCKLDADVSLADVYISDADVIDYLCVCDPEKIKSVESNIFKYKLRKSYRSEDSTDEHSISEVLTKTLHELTIEDRNMVMIAYLVLEGTGKIWCTFGDRYNNATTFYNKKDSTLSTTKNNLRCLVNSHNLLKILQRFIKDYVLDDIFKSGKVNNEINVAKNFVSYVRVGDDLIRQVNFTGICDMGMCIRSPEILSGVHEFIVLDLSNAYNNVTYDFMYDVLVKYLSVNLALGITRLIRHTRFYDTYIGKEMRRNKGVPQGCPISMDIFILCMDYLSKQYIGCLTSKYPQMKYGVDYSMQIYVDDVLLVLKTGVSKGLGGDMLCILDGIFNANHFMLNMKKSRISRGLCGVVNLEVVASDHKYLGIYLESDPVKYLQLVENEIRMKWPQNPNMKSLAILNQNVNVALYEANRQLNQRLVMSLRGKLNYRLRPFASSNEERGEFMLRHGYGALGAILYG